MKRISILLLLCYFLLCTSCSTDEEKEKSSIDSLTEETAQKAVQYIQDPLDKAQAIQKLVDERSGEIEKESEDKN